MIGIIKTNLSINTNNNEILDHQSYIENEESWDAFIEKVKSGYLFSKRHTANVENIVHDDFHLSCDIYTQGYHTKHIAYIEGRVITEY